jgi:hypothetical protein
MERTTETTGSRERTDRVNVVIAAKDPKQSKEDGGNPHEILESLVDEKVIPSDYSTRCTTEELRAAPIIRELGIPCLVLEHMVGIYHQHNHHIATRLLERINNIQDTINRVYANVEHTLVFRTNPRDHGKTSDADVIITSPEFNGISESKRGRLFLNRWNKEEWGPIDVTAFTPEEYESNLNSSGSIVQKAESDGVRII